MVSKAVSKVFSKLFGSRNQRMVKSYHRRVAQINEFESQVRQLTDEQLKARTAEFRQRVADGQAMSSILPEVMAVAREAMDRAVGLRKIFDPEAGFDPTQLPENLQPLYHETLEKSKAIEPQPVQGGAPAPGYLQVEVPLELYNAVREIYPQSRPPFRARPFDVQLIGGMVLSEGKVAEMKTGEGKTIVAPLACYAACIENHGCHVITVNDYLVQRDRDWVFPFYYALGLTVGAIHPHHMAPPQAKAEAYLCDVVYGTNSEFGFDYLRDNMKMSTQEQVQKRRDFCIVDEVDSILIDEARTPLIISGPAHDQQPRYALADQLARHLIQCQAEYNAADDKVEQANLRIKGLEGDIRNSRDKEKIAEMKAEMKELAHKIPILEAERDQFTQYYEVNRERKAVYLAHDGVEEAQKQANIGSFYVGNNMDLPHLLENALRAHVIYERDKEYVVQDGDVVIVDEFTGRLMVGRQWSDGLHQAVETKENVEVKQETQTMATVTLQNFFKLYKRLAGMTGTAITEATEFREIYELDVVCIPTNRDIARHDREDLIFLSAKDKWNAILDEIKRVHDYGRPVLVGTTSVEKSEMLSKLLTQRHGIKHETLNAKQHEREAHIVENAGELGAVMIATNMAGRGTDIKLRPIPREKLVRHWQQRNLLPKQASPDMADDELIALAYRHTAAVELGLKKRDVEELTDEDLKTQLFRKWVVQYSWVEEKKAERMDLEACIAELDALPDFRRHRLQIWDHIEAMGGLHIVGTERHEARRIDNQLRGRAGRQGDNGSSRFFISLEDDLMKLFAGKTTMAALSRLGMKEGDAIEHSWVTKSVERAQRKVEERNYQIRKQLLEFDELMEHQRNTFYDLRQRVLEGREIRDLIFEYFDEAIDDACELYLDPEYRRGQVAEWCRQNLEFSLDPARIHLDSRKDLEEAIRSGAIDDSRDTINVTLGEYMADPHNPDTWDTKGLSTWAMSRFSVNLPASRIKDMSEEQVRDALTEAAAEQVDKRDLSELAVYLEPKYGHERLAEWAKAKFEVTIEIDDIFERDVEDVIEHILEKAKHAYSEREIVYPVEYHLEAVYQGALQDQRWALDQLLGLANQRYQLGWTDDTVGTMTAQQIYDTLMDTAQLWLRDGKLESYLAEEVGQRQNDLPAVCAWVRERFGVEVLPDELDEADDVADYLNPRCRESLRSELTQLERFVLLQILDQAWKDHLYGMDQLKDSIGLRGYAEKDPRIEYKREGARQFREMQAGVRDRVTELIFRAKLTPNVQLRNVYGNQQQAMHPAAQSAIAGAAQNGGTATAEAPPMTAETEQRLKERAAQMREQGGAQPQAPLNRKQRRARGKGRG
ncbi:preprotein translocase subunit SecA [Mucisphaera calidilacus]|uniref:Protein translocase subunit SecA n=1 Tax=Mucisphaera calidilacus TaxID=2527982 RepID=A0A518BZ91_9BACT|nr:preprotein translocase subunit SecA [Mucisphaera calidilacus]QDU72290.1 preprotein translocase subunit SecA [Mucisphaera calidilacus]